MPMSSSNNIEDIIEDIMNKASTALEMAMKDMVSDFFDEYKYAIDIFYKDHNPTKKYKRTYSLYNSTNIGNRNGMYNFGINRGAGHKIKRNGTFLHYEFEVKVDPEYMGNPYKDKEYSTEDIFYRSFAGGIHGSFLKVPHTAPIPYYHVEKAYNRIQRNANKYIEKYLGR